MEIFTNFDKAGANYRPTVFENSVKFGRNSAYFQLWEGVVIARCEDTGM